MGSVLDVSNWLNPARLTLYHQTNASTQWVRDYCGQRTTEPCEHLCDQDTGVVFAALSSIAMAADGNGDGGRRRGSQVGDISLHNSSTAEEPSLEEEVKEEDEKEEEEDEEEEEEDEEEEEEVEEEEEEVEEEEEEKEVEEEVEEEEEEEVEEEVEEEEED
ncbi:hypothetical protein NHX12_028006 [Muraenolepis orangiensis]|uniref:Astrotactin-1/2 N-terminal domain-containing protein n=1 Tax=Muraenolepis orangiensis TaxID=630683 RepID=A0A9Q0EGS0_9TELE|nr:hypothetical protein NHX12_028006 [Muraenolepis orangiensis]